MHLQSFPGPVHDSWGHPRHNLPAGEAVPVRGARLGVSLHLIPEKKKKFIFLNFINPGAEFPQLSARADRGGRPPHASGSAQGLPVAGGGGKVPTGCLTHLSPPKKYLKKYSFKSSPFDCRRFPSSILRRDQKKQHRSPTKLKPNTDACYVVTRL